MSLSALQLADCRRHLGYGPAGDPVKVQATWFSYRFFVMHGQLEYRLQQLSTQEEQILIGSGNPNAPASPNITDPNTGTVIDGYLNICNFLEGQIAGSFDNLDTEKAGDWTARKDEVGAKTKLYFFWCRKMAQFLYLPMGYAHMQNFGNGIMVA